MRKKYVYLKLNSPFWSVLITTTVVFIIQKKCEMEHLNTALQDSIYFVIDLYC